eukprot:scaffold82185_cov12-Tisochrysis_lutea.AAC.1
MLPGNLTNSKTGKLGCQEHLAAEELGEPQACAQVSIKTKPSAMWAMSQHEGPSKCTPHATGS